MRVPREPGDSKRDTKRRRVFWKAHEAASKMMQTLHAHQRGRNAWPTTLRGKITNGRDTKPGLDLAVDAMRMLIDLDEITEREASRAVAKMIDSYWSITWMYDAETSADRNILLARAVTLPEEI